VYDLMVTTLDMQSVGIVLRDETSSSYLGRVSIPASSLAAQQSDRPLRKWFDLSEGGQVLVQSQWRPYSCNEERCSSGEEIQNWSWPQRHDKQGCVLLNFDLFFAAGLPPVEDGTEHWFVLSLSSPFLSSCDDDEAVRESFAGPGRESAAHGLDILGGLGIPMQLMNKKDREGLARRLWRQQVKVDRKMLDQSVDVVWDCPFWFTLDTISDAKLKVDLLRPVKGKTKPEGKDARARSRIVGSMEIRLSEAQFGENVKVVDVTPGDDCLEQAVVKYRLQLCPLMDPPPGVPTHPRLRSTLTQDSCQTAQQSDVASQSARDLLSDGPTPAHRWWQIGGKRAATFSLTE